MLLPCTKISDRLPIGAVDHQQAALDLRRVIR